MFNILNVPNTSTFFPSQLHPKCMVITEKSLLHRKKYEVAAQVAEATPQLCTFAKVKISWKYDWSYSLVLFHGEIQNIL